MVQGTFWEADGHSICQTIPCLLYETWRFI